MTITQSDFKYFKFTILVWSLLNMVLNLIGYLTIYDKSEYVNYYYITWFIQSIGMQTLVFSIILIVGYFLAKGKPVYIYYFAIFQFVILHFIFFNNLEAYENQYRFELSPESLERIYLDINQQELIRIIDEFDPLEASFDCGYMVVLDDLFRFYSVWIFLTILYFFIVTWASGKMVNKLVQRQT